MSEHEKTVSEYFAAMRRGADAEGELLALFTPDAEYEEPFSGRKTPARGTDEIRERLRDGWQEPLPDMELDVLTVEVVGDRATSEWECRSSALPAPVRGTDTYLFRDGLIAHLVVAIRA